MIRWTLLLLGFLGLLGAFVAVEARVLYFIGVSPLWSVLGALGLNLAAGLGAWRMRR